MANPFNKVGNVVRGIFGGKKATAEAEQLIENEEIVTANEAGYQEKLDETNSVTTRILAIPTEARRLAANFVFVASDPMPMLYRTLEQLMGYIVVILNHLDSLATPLQPLKAELEKRMAINDSEELIRDFQESVRRAEGRFRDGIRRAAESTSAEDKSDSLTILALGDRLEIAQDALRLHIRGMFGYDAVDIPKVSHKLTVLTTIFTGIIMVGIELYAGQPIFRALGNTIAAFFQSLVWGLSFWVLATLSGQNTAILLGYFDAIRNRDDHFPTKRDPMTDKPVVVYRPGFKVWLLAIVPFVLLLIGAAALLYYRFVAVADMRTASAMKMGALGIVIFSLIAFLVELAISPKHSKQSYRRLTQLQNEVEACTEGIASLSNNEGEQDYLDTLTEVEETYRREVEEARQYALEHESRSKYIKNLFLRLYAEYIRHIGDLKTAFETNTSVIVEEIDVKNKDFDQGAVSMEKIREIFKSKFQPKFVNENFVNEVQEFKPVSVKLPEVEILELGTVRAEIEAELKESGKQRKGFSFHLEEATSTK